MTDGIVTVRKVETPSDFKAFFEFPWVLYKDDPNWVPPLVSMRRELLDKTKDPAWEYIEGDFYGAWRGDKLVGTITAFINHRHNEFHQEHVGWFGTFEVYDDEEAAQALLNTASEWVRSRGYDAIRGPQSFTTHQEIGVLVDGFTRPVMLMPYNKPYFDRVVQSAGFTKAMDLLSFYTNAEMIKAAEERLEKLTAAIIQRGKITIRPINRKKLREEFGLFKELYNAAWDKNWGFVPMTPKELDGMIESLAQFFDPDLAFFAEVDGVPAGLVVSVPDFNQVLQIAYPRPGEPEAFTLLKAVWNWKIRPVMDWMIVPLLGVREEYRKKGVDVVMYYHMIKAALDKGVKHANGGWILETNHDMVSIAKNVGSKAYKTHRIYEKTF